ncbi:hypothetical protein L3X38_025276 [Prunus dulcis]|uniref:Uncharacterized protein n=1 Tax=Prunus dulcis TaxID=3755 RepID=A0AAD4W2J4_PRUDU|nr:hypothetical protein L3X38_025276 [Prunus dulcis]
MVLGEAEEGPAGAGPALKPRERTSRSGWWWWEGRPVAAELVEEDEPTQSAKAPESEGSLLVVATTEAQPLSQSF